MTDDYTPSLEYLRSRYIAEGFAAVESWQRKPEFRRALSNEFDRGIAAHDAEVAAQARADERAVVNAVEALLDRWDQPASRNAVSPFTPEGVLDIAVADLRKTIDAARTPD